jgi:hypothetical protein
MLRSVVGDLVDDNVFGVEDLGGDNALLVREKQVRTVVLDIVNIEV